MAGGTRTELGSSNSDGSTFAAAYPNGQRGTYSSSSLERSGSFRESLDNRVLVSGPGASRNAVPVDIPPLSQYLILEPFSMYEQKYPRFGELRRILGVSVDEHPSGSLQSKPLPPIASEELKRFKASLLETSTRARDRAKMLHESLQKVEKYRNLLSRKRQRNEIPSSEKVGSSNLLRAGSQIHQNPSDLVSQRPEERIKNIVPNKRARSSVADIRSEGRGAIPLRQGLVTDKDKNLVMDKDRNMLRACNGGSMPAEDKICGLPSGGDGWDKKMKRKRSVGTMVTRITDNDRELKQAIQPRANNESRSRSCDGLVFRPGSYNGINNRIDGSSQLSGASSRGILRNDLDNVALPSERRERSTGLDKERIVGVAKGSNKPNIREDTQVGSQSPLSKGKASRARTGSGVMMNSSSNFPRASGGLEGWEQPACLSKVQPLSGATNRKRPLPTGSSSPPVAQWVGQRPQKISRTRRANLVSPVSNLDESQMLSEEFGAPDVGVRLTSMEASGLLLSRGIPNNTQQLKLKPESVPSPAGLSESEESGATENKFKEKGVDSVDVEGGFPNTDQKVAAFVVPMRKNKVSSKEEIGDGVRRQGRSGRGSIQSKPSLPLMKEKMENMDSTKPPRSGRLGSDKSERIGRPPSKKGSDRKAYTRPLHIMNNGSSELTGESDDDREELFAAAKAARKASSVACSNSPFWMEMEPIFASLSSEDIAFVKQQINFAEELDENLCSMCDADQSVMDELVCPSLPSPNSLFCCDQPGSQTNTFGLDTSAGTVCSVGEPRKVETTSGKVVTERWFENVIPLSQRLLGAFIEEDGTEFDCSVENGDPFSQFSSDYSPYGTNSHVENGHKEADLMKSEFELKIDAKSQKNCSPDYFACNGFTTSSNCGSPNIHILFSNDEVPQESVLVHSEIGRSTPDQLQTVGTGFPGISSYECQYEHMSLDDRILMELHSIGLYPEVVPDLAEGETEEIGRDISDLNIRLYQQVRKTKGQLYKLEKAIQDSRETEERNLEQIAMNKLVEMAYKKRTGGRGNHGSSHKNGVHKVSKQVALAFAKRTLDRCQKFEDTGRSCFSDPAFQDVILSAPLHSRDAKYLDNISSGTSLSNVYVEAPSCQLGSQVPDSGAMASGITSSMVERHGLNHQPERGPLDPFQGLSQMPEQTSAKHDFVSNRGKKREVLLDDVVTTSTLSHTLPGGAKGKRTERDRDQNKDSLTRNSVAKAGRPSLSNCRGERKTKTKPKQKIAQLSTSGNGILGRVTESTNVRETVNCGSTKVNQGVGMLHSGHVTQDLPKDIEETIFTNLPLHAIDSIEELDVADELGGQGQDIGSWLNVDEDALQDNDLMGLQIPMDDLSDLKLNF